MGVFGVPVAHGLIRGCLGHGSFKGSTHLNMGTLDTAFILILGRARQADTGVSAIWRTPEINRDSLLKRAVAMVESSGELFVCLSLLFNRSELFLVPVMPLWRIRF